MTKVLAAAWGAFLLVMSVRATPPVAFPLLPYGGFSLDWGAFARNWGLRAAAALLALVWLGALAGWGRAALNWVSRRPVGGVGGLSAGLGFGLAGLAVVGAGLAGLLFPAVLAVLVLLPVAVGKGWSGSSLRLPAIAPGERWWFLAAAFGVLLALPLLLTPEGSWDAQVYHLRFPSFYLMAHRIFAVAGSPFTGYPDLMESHYALALSAGGHLGNQVAKYMHTACWLMAARAIFTVAIPAGRGAAWLAAVVWLLSPLGMQLAGISYIDHATAWMAALCAGLAPGAVRAAAPALLAGAFAGWAFGTKYTGGLAAAGLAGAFLWKGTRLKAAVPALAGFAAAAFAWPARNWLELGNPLYPFASGLLGGVSSPALDFWRSSPPGDGTGIFTRLLYDDGGVDARLGFLAPAAILPALALGASAGPRRRFFLWAFAGWAALPGVGARFLLAFIPAGLMAAAPALSGGGLRAVAVAGVVASLPLAAYDKIHATVMHFDGLAAATGFVPVSNYLRRGLPPTPEYWEGAREIAARTTPRARLLFVAGIKSYYIDRYCFVSHQHIDPAPVMRLARDSADAPRMAVRIRQAGFTHLVFLARAGDDNPGLGLPGMDEAVFARYVAWLRGWTRFEFRSGEFLVYSLGPSKKPRALGRVPMLEGEAIRTLGGDRSEAPRAVGRLERLAPGSSSALFARAALILMQGGGETAAGSLLERATASPEASSMAWRARGYVLSREERHMEAVKCYMAAIELNPEDAEAHFNMGLTLARLGRLPSAMDEFRRAVRLEPGRADFRQALEKVGGLSQ